MFGPDYQYFHDSLNWEPRTDDRYYNDEPIQSTQYKKEKTSFLGAIGKYLRTQFTRFVDSHRKTNPIIIEDSTALKGALNPKFQKECGILVNGEGYVANSSTIVLTESPISRTTSDITGDVSLNSTQVNYLDEIALIPQVVDTIAEHCIGCKLSEICKARAGDLIRQSNFITISGETSPDTGGSVIVIETIYPTISVNEKAIEEWIQN